MALESDEKECNCILKFIHANGECLFSSGKFRSVSVSMRSTQKGPDTPFPFYDPHMFFPADLLFCRFLSSATSFLFSSNTFMIGNS